ncbi:hypothetical protein GMMP15_1250002 [Candidatus Magnetomoraceae bacterium gMMP-15]
MSYNPITLIAIHDILEKAENIDCLPEDWQEINKEELKYEIQNIIKNEDINWYRQIAPWPDGKKFNSSNSGWGLAFVLDVDKDEDKIAHALAHEIKSQHPEYESCARDYTQCLNTDNIEKAFEKFINAREKYLKLKKESSDD